MKKTASILDYSYPFLDPAVWDHEQKLYAYHKDFILRLLNTMYETYQLKQPETWIKDIRIIGSLTTSKWLFTSDMDVHMLVDLTKFIETNMPGTDPKTAYEFLDSTRKEFDRAKILAPMTQHPIEYYFEVPEFITTNTSLVGVYSISTDAWLKEPVIFEADLDFEESKKQVMAQAEEIAEALDGSFSKIDRQIDRITELERVIGAWDQDKQQIFYNKIEEKLKAIEAEILKNIELRQAFIDARHEAQDPMADIEIKFKWLQRFGFFGILSNLRTLMLETGGQVTLQELPLIKKIVSQGTIKEAVLDHSWWISPDGEIFDLDDANDHQEWMQEYGPDFEGRDPIEEGWIRVRLGKNEIDISIKNLNNIPQFLDSFILNYPKLKIFIDSGIDDVSLDYNEAVTNGIQKAVNRALSQKRMGSLKEAAMGFGMWMSPTGELIDVSSHPDYAFDNAKELGLQNIPEVITDENAGETYASLMEQMFEKGWVRLRLTSRELNVELYDLQNIPDMVNDFIIEHPTKIIRLANAWGDDVTVEYESAIENGIQKAVNLQHQPEEEMENVASIKQAFLKEAFEDEPKETDTDICVDFDRTIAQPAKHPAIGEPIEGAKESLAKLKDLGYNVIIYSCRGDTEEGLKAIEEWLDKHDMPYDSIFSGEKPFFKYVIDDRAIHFDSWDKVMEKVEKSDKTASLLIVSYKQIKLWFDPNGKEYKVGSSGAHADWIIDNADFLEKKYGFDSSNWIRDSEGVIADFEGLDSALIATGWSRVGDIDAGWGIEVADLRHIPDYLIDKLMGHTGDVIFEDINRNWVEVNIHDFETQGQKAVNKALTRRKVHAAQWPEAFWIAPDNQVYDARPTHDTWITMNTDLLKKKYGLDFRGSYGKSFDQNIDEILEALISYGWARVGQAMNHRDYIVQINDIRQVPTNVIDYLLGGPDGINVILENVSNTESVTVTKDDLLQGQKGINKAFRIQSRASKAFSKIDIIAKTKKVKQGEYGAIMALVPHDIAQEIVEFGVRNIKDSDVFSDKNNPRLGRELEPHVTVKYGLLEDSPKTVRRFFNDSKPFKAKLGKVRHFEPPEMEFDVVTIEVISEDLEHMNKKVTEHFKCAKGLVSDEYHPHITLSYVKRGKGKDYVGSDEFEGKEIILDTLIISPRKGNRTYFSIGSDKESSFILEQINKVSSGNNFLPSLFNDTNNEWQFEHGGDDQEIDLQPDSVSDETTWYAPCTEGKPRTKEVWRQFMSMFRNPFSKKEEMTVDSAYDPELEQKEKDALGEDETLLEYSKGFYDPKKHDFPHNTTWLNTTYQDQEPSKPLPVTYSPQISNEDNLDQNSPGGFPRRFMGKPKGEWFSDEGEVVPALQNMWKYRASALDNMTIDITAITRQYALYVGGRLAIRTLTRQKAMQICQERFPEYFARGDYQIKEEAYTVSKQAGSYSSTYTDEQGEEMYNEQHMNDTDCEPYVNHQERDYSWGYHDSPENTGQNTPWAKDITPYVVRLDILENPAYRSDPFGIGEYNVTWYESLPASDGIEQGNSD